MCEPTPGQKLASLHLKLCQVFNEQVVSNFVLSDQCCGKNFDQEWKSWVLQWIFKEAHKISNILGKAEMKDEHNFSLGCSLDRINDDRGFLT